MIGEYGTPWGYMKGYHIGSIDGIPYKLIRVDVMDAVSPDEPWKEGVVKLADMALQDYNRHVVNIPHYERKLIYLDGKWILYTLVDEVKGRSITSNTFRKEEQPRVAAALDVYFTNLSRLVGYRYHNGGVILDDVQIEQLLWGRTRGQHESRLYMVDIEPLYILLRPYDYKEFQKARGKILCDHISCIVEDIQTTEAKFKHPMHEGRRETANFLQSIHPSDPNFENAQNLLRELQTY